MSKACQRFQLSALVGVDLHGRIYVIAQDLPEGLISFSEDGQFRPIGLSSPSC